MLESTRLPRVLLPHQALCDFSRGCSSCHSYSRLPALGRNRESHWLAGCQIVSTQRSSGVAIFQFPVYSPRETEAAKKIEAGRAHRSVADSSFQTSAELVPSTSWSVRRSRQRKKRGRGTQGSGGRLWQR